MTLRIVPPITDESIATGIRRHLWTRTEVSRALQLGLFSSEQRMELIAGDLIEKMTQNRPYGISLSKSQCALEAAFGVAYYLSVQTPLAVDEENEPEPDLMVIVGTPDDYQDHPTAADVALVMEVSDTTLRYDQNTKARLYACAGVVEYWILILKTRTLEVRRDPIALSGAPDDYAYRGLTLYRETDSVTPLNTANAIRVATLLPVRRADVS